METQLYGDDAPTTWAQARTFGIGGSEAASILGLNPWCSAYTLWCRKAGLIAPLEQTEAMRWGHKLEDVIAAYYAEETGLMVADRHEFAGLVQLGEGTHDGLPEVYPDGTLFRSKANPWQLASVDRFVHCPRRGWGPLEIKNVSIRVRDRWAEGVPDYVRAQNLHYQQVLGATWGAVAVLFGGNDPGFMDVEAENDELTKLLTAERAFWQSLEAGDAPDPDGSESTRDALAELYPDAEPGRVVALSDDALQLDRDLVEHKRLAKFHGQKAKGLETMIRAEIGAAEVGVLPSGVQWKTTTVEPTFVPAHTRKGYRKYFRSEPKSKR